MKYFTRRLEKSGGPFITGKDITIADLFLARFIDGLVLKKFDHVTGEHVQQYPAVWKHYQATVKHQIWQAEAKAEEEKKKQVKKQ